MHMEEITPIIPEIQKGENISTHILRSALSLYKNHKKIIEKFELT